MSSAQKWMWVESFDKHQRCLSVTREEERILFKGRTSDLGKGKEARLPPESWSRKNQITVYVCVYVYSPPIKQ